MTRFIDTYVKKHKPAPEYTRPSLQNIRKEESMKSKHEYEIGEGTLKVEVNDKGLKLKYISIDDFYIKDFSLNDLMELLGYYKKGENT